MIKFILYKVILRIKDFFLNTKIIPRKYVYSSNSYRSRIDEKYTNINSYTSVVDDFLKANFNDTPTDISFLGVKLGTSRKQLLQSLGIPKATITVSSKHDLQVLYYKKSFAKQRARIEFHFYRKKLFYIHVRLSRVNAIIRKDLYAVLKKKYGAIHSSKDLGYKNHNGHTLMINDNLNFNLNYFLLDAEFLKNLNFETNLTKKRKSKSKENEIRYYYENL